jgi:probable rRNA maturation factor
MPIEFHLQIQSDSERPLTRPRIRRLLSASLDARVQYAELTLVFLNRAKARSLNRDFRKKDYATNVLTFAYEGPPRLLADLIFCTPVVREEARAQKKTFEHHLAHLIVHGCLHACGLDHQDDAEADAMEALEARILKRFRIPNPYGTLGGSKQPMPMHD